MKRLLFLAVLAPFAALAQDMTGQLATPALPQQATIGQQIAAQVLPIVATLLSGLVGLVLLAARNMLQAKAGESKMASVGAKVVDFVITVVRDIESTIKPEIAEAAKDGVITPEEGRKLRQLAIDRVKAMLGQRGLQELQAVLGLSSEGVEHYLGGLIETTVAQIVPPKPSAASLMPPAIPPVVPSFPAPPVPTL